MSTFSLSDILYVTQFRINDLYNNINKPAEKDRIAKAYFEEEDKLTFLIQQIKNHLGNDLLLKENSNVLENRWQEIKQQSNSDGISQVSNQVQAFCQEFIALIDSMRKKNLANQLADTKLEETIEEADLLPESKLQEFLDFTLNNDEGLKYLLIAQEGKIYRHTVDLWLKILNKLKEGQYGETILQAAKDLDDRFIHQKSILKLMLYELAQDSNYKAHLPEFFSSYCEQNKTHFEQLMVALYQIDTSKQQEPSFIEYLLLPGRSINKQKEEQANKLKKNIDDIIEGRKRKKLSVDLIKEQKTAKEEAQELFETRVFSSLIHLLAPCLQKRLIADRNSVQFLLSKEQQLEKAVKMMSQISDACTQEIAFKKDILEKLADEPQKALSQVNTILHILKGVKHGFMTIQGLMSFIEFLMANKNFNETTRNKLSLEALQWIKDLTANDNEAIRSASASGYIKVVKRLLSDERVDPSARYNYAICAASHNGHAEVVRELLNNTKVDPTANNHLAICAASDNGHAEVVRELLNSTKVDPAAIDNYAICTASLKGHVEVVKLLLANSRVDPTVKNNGPLVAASYNGHVEVVKLLLADSRIDPTGRDNSAIKMAAQNGHTEVIKELLIHPKVDPAVDGNSTIYIASYHGHVEVVKLLLADSRVDPTDDDNETLILAIQNGHVQVVKELLSHPKVDPNAQNHHAILFASENGQLEIIKLLLTNSKFNLKAQGKNAALQAQKNGHIEIAKMLFDALAGDDNRHQFN